MYLVHTLYMPTQINLLSQFSLPWRWRHRFFWIMGSICSM